MLECSNCHNVLLIDELYTIEENGKEYALCSECGQWFVIEKIEKEVEGDERNQ